jgi:formate dehydrogenase subunit delta
MDIHHLCRMANQIGQFYRASPDRNEALLNTASHLRRFWDPRMRRELLAHLDEQEGAGLEPFVIEAVKANRQMLEPPQVAAEPG